MTAKPSRVSSLGAFAPVFCGHLEIATTFFAYLQPQAQRKHITLEVATELGVGLRYRGDSLRLQQIITNYLDNAIRFTPDGGRVSVLVSDQGPAAATEV